MFPMTVSFRCPCVNNGWEVADRRNRLLREAGGGEDDEARARKPQTMVDLHAVRGVQKSLNLEHLLQANFSR